MEVVDIMKNGGHSAGVSTTVFDDCYFMACDFSRISFDCNREANKVARELARLARFSETMGWFEEPLVEIVKPLIDDVTVISN